MSATASSRPARLLLPLLLLSLGLLAASAGSALAATIEASASAFTGAEIDVSLLIDDDGEIDGGLEITLTVSDGSVIGDLRGFFAQIADESLLSGLSVVGDDVTESAFAANDVINLGGGANLNGEPGLNPCPCDLGVELGTPGIGSDDLQSVTFTLLHTTEDLSVDLLAGLDFGVRVTSVGASGGSRGDSSKLVGVVPEPSTALLFALGLGGLASVGRARD